jgi:hypothetical protein
MSPRNKSTVLILGLVLPYGAFVSFFVFSATPGSPLPLSVGTPLSMTLRVPTFLSGSPRTDVQCTDRVVHECSLRNGDIGYGIHFEQMLNFQQGSLPQSAAPQPSTNSPS